MRTLKPEAATSETLSEVPRWVRWTFSMLWTHCDDKGRALWNAKLIKAAIYPLDDDVTPEVLEVELAELLRVGSICRYEVDGKTYMHVPAWDEHQHPNRPVPSKLPPCPHTDDTGTTHAQRSEPALPTPLALIPVVVGVDGEVEVEVGELEVARQSPQAAPNRNRGTRLPKDFSLPGDWFRWGGQRRPRRGTGPAYRRKVHRPLARGARPAWREARLGRDLAELGPQRTNSKTGTEQGFDVGPTVLGRHGSRRRPPSERTLT
jgi:hypothetical protein